ncbi:MAG: type II restriction endonuclease subunit M [Gammaproteobacteria bacterium]
MTTFLRLLAESDKAGALWQSCACVRDGANEPRCFDVAPEEFDAVPGKPFSYWVAPQIRSLFKKHRTYADMGWKAVNGLTTGNDFRFVRAHWEVLSESRLHKSTNNNGVEGRWVTYAKGGENSPYHARFPMVLNWAESGKEMKAFAGTIIRSEEYYLKSGLTWPLRARRFGPQCRPNLSIFSVRGYSAIAEEGELLVILGLTSSTPFDYLFKVSLGRHGFPEFVVGTLTKLPVPEIDGQASARLGALARSAWSYRRILETISETSHAFLLPAALRPRAGDFDPPSIETELARIQSEIDTMVFDLYGFSDADQAATLGEESKAAEDEASESPDADGDEDDGETDNADGTDGLLSWAVGVAFGRFDWRLATDEREAPPEPDPFDPLPVKSPGMLPDGAKPFHAHAGILVDEQGHPHDLARLVEEVLARVDVTVPDDVRRWLQREFFAFHLQRYSKSRRKAPIYWPLATTSGSHTLWIYWPSVTGQTLYMAINEFVEPRIKQVGADVTALRNKGSARTRDDEKQFEALQAFELELIELRDTLLKLAPTYKPNHDDGVQISAAPLWLLFRHKPWQKVLKDTWVKLEKGSYDWAHLGMNYWPERVREKCKTDKSLAIAHSLEDQYIEPEAPPKKARGRKGKGA